MTPPQRQASRFFDAFFNWNHIQRPQSYPLLHHREQDRARTSASKSISKYNETPALRTQSRLKPQLQSDEAQTAFPGPNPEEDQLKTEFRELFRKVPSSVTIVTVSSFDPDIKKHVPMGIALSSLTSVALDPPTISFNIKQNSKTLDAIRAANGLFRVHFLAANRSGAKIAELFCQGNNLTTYNLRSSNLRLHIPSIQKEKGEPSSLAPQISDLAVEAAMECRVTHEFPVADHVILAARVDKLKPKKMAEQMIVYVGGKYRYSNIILGLHASPEISGQSKDGFSVWDFPLFPEEQERRGYVKHIKSLLKKNPDYLAGIKTDGLMTFQHTLPYHPSYLGINLDVLVAECRREMGLKSTLTLHERSFPVLFDFYGRLSPSDRANIVDRAVRLVKEDTKFLSLSFGMFLKCLGVSPKSKDLLSSDIMSSLRAQGLVDEFKSDLEDYASRQTITYDIKLIEQIEFRLRDYLATLHYKTARNIPFESAMEAIGEDNLAAINFKNSRDILLCKTHPQRFMDSEIDIEGHLNPEEVRVVLARYIRFLNIDKEDSFRARIASPVSVILQLIKVHPSITGMNVEYLHNKFYHMLHSQNTSDDIHRVVKKMLLPWFDHVVEWNELEKRLKSFVENRPLRAVSWTTRDQLAAMGLHWDAKLKVPTQDASFTHHLLTDGLVLSTLIAKELKNFHKKATVEQKKAIAEFLLDRHKFDVDNQTNADASNNSTGYLSAEHARGKSNQKSSVSSRSASKSAARIRFQSNQNTSRTHGNVPKAKVPNDSTGQSSADEAREAMANSLNTNKPKTKTIVEPKGESEGSG